MTLAPSTSPVPVVHFAVTTTSRRYGMTVAPACRTRGWLKLTTFPAGVTCKRCMQRWEFREAMKENQQLFRGALNA